MNRRAFLASLGVALAAPKAIFRALANTAAVPAPVPFALKSATTWGNCYTATPLTQEQLTEAIAMLHNIPDDDVICEWPGKRFEGFSLG